MNYTVIYIKEITVVQELGIFQNVYAAKLKLRNPFYGCLDSFILRVFLFLCLWFFAGLSLGSQPNRLIRGHEGVIGPQKIISLYIRGGGVGSRYCYSRRSYKLTIQFIMLKYLAIIVLSDGDRQMQGDYTSYASIHGRDASRQIPALVIKISGLKRFHPDCLNRVYEKIEFQNYKQGLRRANREKAKHLISGNLEREGDNLTATADHSVVAHMLKSIAEKNCLYFTCYIRVLLKGLVMGPSPSTPS